MINLTDKLKQEHADIIELLEEVRILGISSYNGYQLLKTAHQLFLRHIINENRFVTKILQANKNYDSEFKQTLIQAVDETRQLFSFSQEFFDKYSKSKNRLTGQFTLDVSKFLIQIKSHFSMKERSVYIVFDKLINQQQINPYNYIH